MSVIFKSACTQQRWLLLPVFYVLLSLHSIYCCREITEAAYSSLVFCGVWLFAYLGNFSSHLHTVDFWWLCFSPCVYPTDISLLFQLNPYSFQLYDKLAGNFSSPLSHHTPTKKLNSFLSKTLIKFPFSQPCFLFTYWHLVFWCLVTAVYEVSIQKKIAALKTAILLRSPLSVSLLFIWKLNPFRSLPSETFYKT